MTTNERELLTVENFFDSYPLDEANDYLDDILNECLGANEAVPLENSQRHWFIFKLKKMLAFIEPVKDKERRHKRELKAIA